MHNRNASAIASAIAFIASFAFIGTGCSEQESVSNQTAAPTAEPVQVAAVQEPVVTTPPTPRNAPPAAAVQSDAPEGWSSGPEVGTKIPDFIGVDQNGESRTFADIVGPEGAYIVFTRSADWWPFCKTQLVQLEQSYEELTAQGLGVVSISYDSVDILKDFSGRKGPFSFSMIGDEGSKIIDSFGLKNPTTQPGTRTYGMAWPGSYIVDKDGVVVEKFFEHSHTNRLTAESLLMSVYGAGEAGGQRLEADVQPQFNVAVFPSEDIVQGGNQFVIVADFALYDKVHLYAEGSSYQAVNIVLDDNPLYTSGDLRVPEAEMLRLEVIDETVPIYEGEVRVSRVVTMAGRLQGESVDVSGRLDYQTCDDELCYQPASMPFKFTLNITQHDRARVAEDIQHKDAEGVTPAGMGMGMGAGGMGMGMAPPPAE